MPQRFKHLEYHADRSLKGKRETLTITGLDADILKRKPQNMKEEG
jgi:hypothetical protein